MTTTFTPIRRSPLQATHAALHARWVSDTAHWPTDYGSPEKEAAAVREGAGILDWGPLDKFSVKGSGVAAALAALGGRMAVREIAPHRYDAAGAALKPADPGATAGGEVEVWGLAADEALVLVPPGAGLTEETIVAASAGTGAYVTNVSSTFAVLRLAGPHSGRVFEELCPVDLRPHVFADHAVMRGGLASVHVSIGRRDLGGLPAYTVVVVRDLAEYLWDALLHTGQAHGLTPSGARAFELLR